MTNSHKNHLEEDKLFVFFCVWNFGFISQPKEGVFGPTLKVWFFKLVISEGLVGEDFMF